MKLSKSSQLLFVLLFLSVSQILPVPPAYAEENITIGEIVVTATKIEESAEDIAQDVTVIRQKEIESGSYRNLSEVIRNAGGLNLFEYGNRGSFASVSLRGSTSEQTLVLIDGKRLNKPGDGQVDLNAVPIPLENIERIEILRGAASALYGADAIGGVINIITKIPDESRTNLSASYGRFVTKELRLNTSQKIKDTGFYLSLSKDKSDGFRTNSDYDMHAINTKMTYAPSQDMRADFTLDYNHRDAGAPGSLSWLTPLASQTDEDLLAGLTVKMKETLLKLYSNTSKVHYENPGSENNTHNNHVLGIDLQHSLLIGQSNLLIGGMEILEEDINSKDIFNPDNSIGRHSRTRKGMFIQDESTLYEKAVLTLGLRYDDIASLERFSPKASLLIKLPWQTNLAFSAGQGFRVPEMNALFWPDTGWAVGNPDLKPEKSTEYESSIQKFFGNTGDVRLVGFEKRVSDLIQWQENGQGKWSPVNVAKARIRGVEMGGKLSLKALDLRVSYTFMDPQDIMTGKKIRFSTRHQIKGSTSIYPAKGATIALEWSYVSNYAVQEGDPSCYFLLDGKISQKLYLPKVTPEIFLIGKNILNRDFQTTRDYPMPPVQFIGGISFSF
jgi:outer membrane cobalamin receptor